MSSYPWNVCRTCLSVENIYPIFTMAEHHQKYTDVIFTATGVKVEFNDNLPQQICSFCITFINDSIKFRKKCEDTNMELLSRLIDKQIEYPIKIETSPPIFKTENDKSTMIDISHLLPDLDEDFKDYDDNITLDSLQCHNSIGKTDVELDYQDKNAMEKPVLIEENIEPVAVEKPKRKLRSSKKENVGVKKKETKTKGERVREEVECEYCHKILTSRLSLRNHYKIHTGFDVVCEHCGKKFITRRLLLMHCRAKHGYEKTDKCSYCDYKASNAEQVKIHERLHTGEKPYVCAECGAGFHRKSSYLQHVAIHLPEKTVQCEQCPARFKSATLMRIHSARHKAPSYTFHCRLCGNMFARRRNVARHLQRVHAAPPEPHIDRRRINHNNIHSL